MMRRITLLFMMLFPLVAGCGGHSTSTTVNTPVPTGPGHLVESPTVTLPDGTAIRIELAVTPEERQQGLMFRPSLKPDHGMLFLFEQSAQWPFWMKNTWIPLDLVYLDEHGTVRQIFADVPPCHADPCPQYVPATDALAVLELAAGTAAAHGVEPGTTLKFSRVPDYPLE